MEQDYLEDMIRRTPLKMTTATDLAVMCGLTRRLQLYIREHS